MSATDEKPISFKEAIDLLGVGEDMAREILNSPKGPAIRFSTRYVIYRSAVERWKRGESGFWDRAIAGLPEDEAPHHHPTPISPAPITWRLVPDGIQS